MFFSIACASYAWAVSTSSSKEPMNVFSPSTWISRRRLPPQRTPMKLVEVPPPLPARAVAQRSPRGAAAMRDIADAAAALFLTLWVFDAGSCRCTYDVICPGHVHSLTSRSWCSTRPPSNSMVRRPSAWRERMLGSERGGLWHRKGQREWVCEIDHAATHYLTLTLPFAKTSHSRGGR